MGGSLSFTLGSLSDWKELPKALPSASGVLSIETFRFGAVVSEPFSLLFSTALSE
jgi:hypothetical protein